MFKKNDLFLMFLSFVVWPQLSLAFPFPFPDRNWEMFHYGFEMEVSSGEWILTGPQEYSLPENRGLLKWSILPTSTDSLQILATDWKKQFYQLGFKIESLEVNQDSVVFNLHHPERKKRLRQLVMKGPENMILLTCAANQNDFPTTMVKCSQSWKTFRWLSPAPPKIQIARPITQGMKKLSAKSGEDIQPSLSQNK